MDVRRTPPVLDRGLTRETLASGGLGRIAVGCLPTSYETLLGMLWQISRAQVEREARLNAIALSN